MTKILAIVSGRGRLFLLKAAVKESYPEAEVFSALDKKEAEEQLAVLHPDIIFLDALMNGAIEMCRSLKQDSHLRKIPVIYLTDKGVAEEDRLLALESGVEAFLSYPIDRIALTALVRSLLLYRKANSYKGNQEDLSGIAENPCEKLKKELREKKDSETFLKKLYANLDEAIFSIDILQNRMLQASQAHQSVFGYPPGDFFQNPLLWYELVLPEDKPIVDAGYPVLRSGKNLQHEFRILRSDGQIRWIETRMIPTLDPQGQLVRVDGISSDITERKQSEQALKHSYELMSYIIEHSNGGVAVFDRDLRYIYVSERFLNDFHLKDRDIIGKHHYELFPDLPLRWKEAHQNALSGEVLSSEEDFFLQKDGSVEWTRWECRPWYEADTTIGGVILYTEFITERKKAELALRESEHRFLELAEHSRTIAWEVDQNGLYTFVSALSDRLFGYSPEELVGKMHFFDLTPESDREELKAGALEIFARKEMFSNFENPIQTKDGRIIWVFTNGFPLLDANHQLLGYRGSDTDITEQKHTEKELNNTYEMLTKLADQVPGVVYQYRLYPDGRSCFPYSSSGMMDIYGVTSEEVREDATPVFGQLHPEDHEYIVSSILESARTLEIYHSEYRVILPEKGVCWRLCDAKPERMEDGSTLWYGIITDITDRKMYEMELLQAKEKAEESDRLKTAFLANMSHEIRTPMNGILGFINLLFDEPNLAEEEKKNYMDIVNKSGQRLLDTINDIIEISKIEAGESEVSMTGVNLEEVMKFHHDFFFLQAQEKGLSIFIPEQITGSSAHIKTDKHKLDGILTNLIKNAIKFTVQGHIELGNYLEHDMVVFYVRDTGRGISSDRLEAIFERFVQADLRHTRAHEGSGLGLSIVKAYVDALGGKIRVQSEVGKGSTFIFSIPYFISVKNSESVVSKVPVQESFPAPMTLLVAEDDESSYQFLEIILAREGFRLIHTVNGEDTVNALRDHPDIALILMDVNMPGIDGLEATRQIREFNKTIPIIAQTAYALSGDEDRAKEAGCNDYISKPIRRNELIRMILSYV